MPQEAKRKKVYSAEGRLESATTKGEKADDYVDPDESRIGKGLSDLAARTDSKKREVETPPSAAPSPSPSPSPTPSAAGGGLAGLAARTQAERLKKKRPESSY